MMTTAIFVAIALVCGTIAIFAANSWLKAATYTALVVALLAIWYTALGHPRPALFGVPKGTVLSYALDEPIEIDVLVKPSKGGPATLWGLPWNEQDAAALDKAAHDASVKHVPLEMRGKQQGGKDGYDTKHRAGPVFYPAPAPQLPPKAKIGH